MWISLFSVLGLTFIVFALCRRFEQTALSVIPMALCGVGLVLYLLGFVHALSAIDWILMGLGLACLIWAVLDLRRGGRGELVRELRRQAGDLRLWVGLAAVALIVVLLRDARILEWDGYNFWGPSTKALYFRDGYAARHSNPASGYGTYTPMGQLLWWWGVHLTGGWRESAIFQVYYTFGALLLLSSVRHMPRRGVLPDLFICAAALLLPGVADTAWYRALCVDPWMSFLFGAALVEIAFPDRKHPGFWRARILLYLLTLTLVKSIGLLWALFALLFHLLWNREARPWRFALLSAGACCALSASWSVFCRVMDRSTYLSASFVSEAAARLSELRAGNFLTAGNTWGYITSYIRAFFLEALHREFTPALDLSTALFLACLILFALLLRRRGAVEKGQLRRLLLFMGAALLTIYLIVAAGQMTMFYSETQYLEPLRAVTLMSRYASPAQVGLMMLLFALSGREPDAGSRGGSRAFTAAVLAGCFILSAGAYTQMWRRFVRDDLDPQREETRSRWVNQYRDFLDRIGTVPYKEADAAVLLAVWKTEMNPVIVNEASPVAVDTVYLSGAPAADTDAILGAVSRRGNRFFYAADCPEETADALSAHTEGGAFRAGTLYTVTTDGGTFTLRPAA